VIARTLVGPAVPCGVRVEVPTSKSITNRALVAAAVAGGGCVAHPLDCEDTRLLARALEAAGWPMSWQDNIEIGSRRPIPSHTGTIDLGNSGTGSRFLLALLAAVPGRHVVDGTARLRQRPMSPLLTALDGLGASLVSRGGFLPVEVRGTTLDGGRLRFAPGVSSQFVSALLLIAPLMRDGLELELEGTVPSRPYLDLTEDVLLRFGGAVERNPGGRRWRVAPGPLRETRIEVEGDWCAAAFFLGAAAVAGGSLEVGPLSDQSRQGDRKIVDVLRASGMSIEQGVSTVEVGGGPLREPLSADLRDAPDLFPALAVMASFAPPGSTLTGLDNLRHKESDRLAVMVDNLRRLGAGIEVSEDSVTIARPVRRGSASGQQVMAAGDHRVAMAMAVAALAAGALELDDGGCVVKSFPTFWDVWDRLLS